MNKIAAKYIDPNPEDRPTGFMIAPDKSSSERNPFSEEAGETKIDELDLEAGALGSLLFEHLGPYKGFFDNFQESHFHKAENKLIYAACERLYKSRKHIQPLAVVTELEIMGQLEAAGGEFYINELGRLNLIEQAYRFLEKRELAGITIKYPGPEKMNQVRLILKALDVEFETIK